MDHKNVAGPSKKMASKPPTGLGRSRRDHPIRIHKENNSDLHLSGNGTGVFSKIPVRTLGKFAPPDTALIPILTSTPARDYNAGSYFAEADKGYPRLSRRSRSVGYFNECEDNFPVVDDQSVEELRRDQTREQQPFSFMGSFRKKSVSLISLNDWKGSKSNLLHSSTQRVEDKRLGKLLSSISWFLHNFGYNGYSESLSLKYELLTGREYLDTCMFVVSRICDVDYAETLDEIITCLLELATEMKYTSPLRKSTLKSPIAPAMRTATINFLFWLCTRVYNVKLRRTRFSLPPGQEQQPGDIEDISQSALRIYHQCYETEDFTGEEDKYREYLQEVKFWNLEDPEHLDKEWKKLKISLHRENIGFEREMINHKIAIKYRESAIDTLNNLKKNSKKNYDFVERNVTLEVMEKALVFNGISLCKELADLEEKANKAKIPRVQITGLKNELTLVNEKVKEHIGVQKRLKSTVSIFNMITKELHEKYSDFKYDILPVLNHILKIFGLNELDLNPPENSQHFIEQMKIISAAVNEAIEAGDCEKSDSDSDNEKASKRDEMLELVQFEMEEFRLTCRTERDHPLFSSRKLSGSKKYFD